jgi:hypothetical protein
MTPTIHFPTLDEIRARAYQIYLARGSGRSHELDDWLQAEYELMQLPLHKIAELEANAIESNRLKLFSLARVALTLQQRSSKQESSLRSPARILHKVSLPTPKEDGKNPAAGFTP